MYKFVVLSVLIFGCSAGPALNYGSTGYSSYGSSGSSYGSGYGASLVAPQRVQLVGAQGGYGGLRSGYGSGLALNTVGLGSGLTVGSGYGSGLAVGSGLGLVSGSGLAVQSGLQSGLAINSGLAANNNFGLLSVRQGQQFEPVVNAAVQQIGRTVEYRALPYQEQPIQAQVIEVEPSDNPVHLHFKSRSSTLSLSQSHTPAAAQETQVASSQDEPSRLITEVQKPVIQEVREVISPYRQVTQEINPVVESLHTVVTKAEGQRAQYSGAVNYGSQYANAGYGAQTIGVQAVRPVGIATSQVVAPVAVQAVQAAPAISIQSVRPIGIQGSYGQSASFAAPALQTSYQSSSYAAPAVQSSSLLVNKPLQIQSSSYNTASTSGSSADGY